MPTCSHPPYYELPWGVSYLFNHMFIESVVPLNPVLREKWKMTKCKLLYFKVNTTPFPLCAASHQDAHVLQLWHHRPLKDWMILRAEVTSTFTLANPVTSGSPYCRGAGVSLCGHNAKGVRLERHCWFSMKTISNYNICWAVPFDKWLRLILACSKVKSTSVPALSLIWLYF